MRFRAALATRLLARRDHLRWRLWNWPSLPAPRSTTDK
jgi:hypothetical protein